MPRYILRVRDFNKLIEREYCDDPLLKGGKTRYYLQPDEELLTMGLEKIIGHDHGFYVEFEIEREQRFESGQIDVLKSHKIVVFEEV